MERTAAESHVNEASQEHRCWGDKHELLAQGYPVRSVKQLTKKENNIEIKLPLFALELENTAKAREIHYLKRLLYTVVAVESYRPRSGLK